MTDSMRDKIEDIIVSKILGKTALMGARDATSAIIKALPDMVVPLVWYDTKGTWLWKSQIYPYDIRREGARSFMVDYDDLTLLGSMGGKHETLDAAKAAANAHHVAQIMAAFGGVA